MYKNILLNGEWQFASGEKQPEQFSQTIPVPGLVDLAHSAGRDTRSAVPAKDNWEKQDWFWYGRTFDLEKIEDDGRVFLQLEQVQYGSEVWLNGKHVGGDIPCYTSQEFDLMPYLKSGENHLLVRVGKKENLPEHAAVGNDFEKISWIPGIWGDVRLHLYGQARITWTQIIPDIDKPGVHLHIETENFSDKPSATQLNIRILEKSSGREVAAQNVRTDKSGQADMFVSIRHAKLWTPENPFLYTLECTLQSGGQISHIHRKNFGLRTFETAGRHFFLNGRRRVLMGGNIPFHRLLSDKHRGNLPWDMQWVRRAFIDIPRQHNMHFFRFHLGRAYNRWYDLADECGMLLQDEWMFWTTTGSEEQIRKEFTAWIKEHGHHPSVVIWDALNESRDERLTETIIPEMKKLDPTRPWEIVDFSEDHPYIWSLGPVLNDESFGYTRSISDLENSKTPVMVNEYNWWWLDSDGNPTPLTQLIIERWLGKNYSRDDVIQRQGWLVRELTELWRRMELDAIMPFVYLSCDGGATANWFWGKLADLNPKPILKDLKEVFAPVGISIELWDRHFCPGEKHTLRIFLFNDTDHKQSVNVHLEIKNHGSLWKARAELTAMEHRTIEYEIAFPHNSGQYELEATIGLKGEKLPSATSRKTVYVVDDPLNDSPGPPGVFALIDDDPQQEMARFLRNTNMLFDKWPNNYDGHVLVLINGIAIRQISNTDRKRLSTFVRNGGILIIQEPEQEINEPVSIEVLDSLELQMEKRLDDERGGYDSRVFPEEPQHFLWTDIRPEYLDLLNGALGGEMVSMDNVRLSQPWKPVALCHLSLLVPAVMEIPYGRGIVVVSRIQVRGRLLKTGHSGLYERRYDPVAVRYFLNLLCEYSQNNDYYSILQSYLAQRELHFRSVTLNNGTWHEPGDGRVEIHWAGHFSTPCTVHFELTKGKALHELTIEATANRPVEIAFSWSGNGKKWETGEKQRQNNPAEKSKWKLPAPKIKYLSLNCSKSVQPGYTVWRLGFK